MSLIRQESKLIRPFLHADDFKNILINVAISLKAGDEFATEELHVIKPEDRDLLHPTLSILMDVATAMDQLEDMGISPGAVKLVVIATASELRLSQPICTFPLKELPEQAIELTPSVRRFLSAKGGCDISVVLLLGEELPVKNLKPHAFGQWLAKKTFSLRPEQPSDDFSIRALTDKDRIRLKLPEGTVHYVEKGGSLNDPDVKLQDCLTIWISESIFNALSRDSSNRTSAAIQKAFLSEIILSVVISEVSDLQNGEMPEEKSPLDGFFDDLSKDAKVTKEQLIQLARQTGDKARLGAHIQQLLDLGSAIKSAF